MRAVTIGLAAAALAALVAGRVPIRSGGGAPAFGASDGRLVDTTVTLNPSSATLVVGQTRQFQAVVRHVGTPISWPPAGLRWRITDLAVATVNTSGLVTAQAPGSTVLFVITTIGTQVIDSAAVIVVAGANPVWSVDVVPFADTLVVQDTLWLRAVVRDSSGSVLTGQQVTWSSTRPSVAPVSGTADSVRVRAGLALGSAIIRATVQNRSDSAWLTVLSLSVNPATATTTIGGTLMFTAMVRDSSGTLVPRQLFWSSTNQAVARILSSTSSTASVQGVGGGSAQVIVATRRGASASAAVTVTDTTTRIGECSGRKPEWLWCDDFETDRLAAYFDYDDARERFVRDSSAGRNSSFGMRARFLAGLRRAGVLKVGIGRTPVGIRPADSAREARRELYWRVFVQHDTGWSAETGARLLQGTSLVNRLGAQAMAAYAWSGDARPRFLAADPASGTDAAGNVRTNRYDDFANLRWLGPTYSRNPVLDSTRAGQWQCVEAYARLNTAGRPDAVFRLWVNDSLEAERTGFNWVGDYRDFGLNAIIIENILGDHASRDHERRYDNLVVSTARIGCNAGVR
jgi:uncharacterized protein YjdB